MPVLSWGERLHRQQLGCALATPDPATQAEQQGPVLSPDVSKEICIESDPQGQGQPYFFILSTEGSTQPPLEEEFRALFHGWGDSGNNLASHTQLSQPPMKAKLFKANHALVFLTHDRK